MSLKILQLSDLHIGKNAVNPEDLVYAVEMALRGKKVDLILFTGDLIDGSLMKTGEYDTQIDEGVKFFEMLIKELNETSINSLGKEDILFIPGNHEINRANYKTGALFDKYEKFLESFYDGNIPHYYDTSSWSFFRDFPDDKIALLGFNSCNYKKDDKKNEEKDFGEISIRQISDLTKKLDKITNISEYNIVSFLHHHFYLIEERYKDYVDHSVLKNSETFLHNLNKYNLGLILHGHKHDSSDRRLIINNNIGQIEKISTVLGCGSTDKDDTTFNNFNYIEVFSLNDSLDLIFKEYTYKNSTFNITRDITLPLKPVKNIKVNIMEKFKELSDLENAYKSLKSIDTLTPVTDLVVLLDKTVGTLNDTAVKIADDKKCIFYLLIAMHYRANFYNDSNFLEQIRNFIKCNLSMDFKENGKTDDLFSILDSTNIYEVNNKYKHLKEKCSDTERKYLAFMLISFYLTELYLNLKDRSEDFYNIKIKYKSDLVFEKKSIRPNIEGNNIEIESDEEKRALGIKVICKNAVAHKITSLIIKEFEIVLNQFEEDFSKIGFKIYYILPNINKLVSDNKLQLESYNFGAYIPTLIPLLAGENLYSQAEAFSRELIQNSVDAINLRKEIDESWKEEGEINVTINETAGKKYFEISDNGTGMDKYLLERYFTTIGRSFYRSEDFDDLKIKYNPISKFGIGFLSCFLVGKKVEVITKYCKGDEHNQPQSFSLDIPNFDGCFFIESINKDKVGTKVKIYENKDKNNFNIERIHKYINDNILNIPYDLNIKIINKQYKIQKNQFVNNIIKNIPKNRLMFFIPFCDENIVATEEIDMDMYYSDEQYRSKYKYGVIIYKKDSELFNGQKITITNSGILIQKCQQVTDSLRKVFGTYFDIFINFPSNLIDLEVSRDEIKSSSKFIEYLNSFKNANGFKVILSRLTNDFLTRKNDIVQKLPYFILRSLDDTKYGIDKLLFTYEKGKYIILYKKDAYLEDYLRVIDKFFINNKNSSYLDEESPYIRYISNNLNINDLFKSILHNVQAYRLLIKIIGSQGEMDKDKAINKAKDRARAMARAMARARDRARDTARNRIMDMDIDVFRNTTLYVARAMDRAREMDMDIDVDIDVDMAMDIARDMDMAMDRAMDRAMDIAEYIYNQRQKNNDILADLYICTIPYEYRKNYKPNNEPFIFHLFACNVSLTIIASYFLNLKQLKKGLHVNIDEQLEIRK